MDCENYRDKIISFIENELSEKERLDFQSELDNDSSLRLEYEEIKKTLYSLNKMPKVVASSDFMFKLNEKIEAHERKSNKNFRSFIDRIISNEYLPQISIGVVSLVCLFVITYFWDFSGSANSKVMLSKGSSIESVDDNQIADLDSLSNEDK